MKLARAVVVALSAMAAIAPIAFADNMQVDHSGQLLRVKRSKDAHSKAELAEDSAKARSTGVAKRKWKKLHGDQETQSLEAQILEEKAKEEVAASLGFRMPDYIEKSPNLYAFGFVCIGLMIFSGICIHVQLEDKRRWQALQQRYARDRVVSMLWARRSEPDELRSHQAPADASADEISRGSISRPIVSGITKLNSAVGSLSAFISGSNYHNPPPELPKKLGLTGCNHGFRTNNSTLSFTHIHRICQSTWQAVGKRDPKWNCPRGSSTGGYLRISLILAGDRRNPRRRTGIGSRPAREG